MSGQLRNFITFVMGLSAYGNKTIGEVTKLSFWVTPFDSGILVLKSDKYFQLAEAALAFPQFVISLKRQWLGGHEFRQP